MCVSDVDECEDPLQCPGQECVNSQGSYRCVSCQPGYRLLNRLCAGKHTCPPCVCVCVCVCVCHDHRDDADSTFLYLFTLMVFNDCCCDGLQTSMSVARLPAPTVAAKTHLGATAVSVTMVTSSRTTHVQVK